MKAEIKHDPVNRRFFMLINGWECILFYEKITEKLWELKKTIIPPSVRGMGISKEIFKHVFDFLNRNNIQVKLSCMYARLFISFHSRYSNLLAA